MQEDQTEPIEKHLYIIPRFETFDETYLLKDDTCFVLNDLVLYGLDKDRFIQKEIDFMVVRDENDHRIIVPLVSYPHYALIGEIICLFPDEERLLVKYTQNQKSAT